MGSETWVGYKDVREGRCLWQRERPPYKSGKGDSFENYIEEVK
jgi:hypothetical protein